MSDAFELHVAHWSSESVFIHKRKVRLGPDQNNPVFREEEVLFSLYLTLLLLFMLSRRVNPFYCQSNETDQKSDRHCIHMDRITSRSKTPQVQAACGFVGAESYKWQSFRVSLSPSFVAG